MFKQNDYIVMSLISFFLGIIIISQIFSAKQYNIVTQPENNAVLALEVAKQTRVNADLRSEALDLTNRLDGYRSTSESNQKANALYLSDMERLQYINGEKPKTGQGILINIKGKLGLPQLVDLLNAIKNIGADMIAIGNNRILLDTNLNQFTNQDEIQIKVLGNSALLKNSMNRKGGIVEQISKDININIEENSEITIPAGSPTKLKYSKIVE